MRSTGNQFKIFYFAASAGSCLLDGTLETAAFREANVGLVGQRVSCPASKGIDLLEKANFSPLSKILKRYVYV